jgi:hypothetical protein
VTRSPVRPTPAAAIALLAVAVSAGTSTAGPVFFADSSAYYALVTSIGAPATFESQPEGSLSSPYVEEGCTFNGSGLEVLTPTTTVPANPMPTSHVLAAGGPDGITITFPAIYGATNIGFDTITNRFAPPVVAIYYLDGGQLAATYALTQPPNSRGFVGIVADQPIGRLVLLSTGSDTESTCIDNVRIGDYVVPVRRTSWGHLRAHYR